MITGTTKPKIIFTVGPPRSGKTEFAKWLLKNPEVIPTDNTLGLVLIDEDSIRLALTGQRFVQESEELVRATKHLMIKSLLSQGYAVIVSDTHSLEASFYPLFEMDKNATPVFLKYNKAGCTKRAKECDSYDLIPVIKRITKNIQGSDFGIFRNAYIAERLKNGDFRCSAQ